MRDGKNVRAVRKLQLEKQIIESKAATASMGKFDRTLKGEKAIKVKRTEKRKVGGQLSSQGVAPLPIFLFVRFRVSAKTRSLARSHTPVSLLPSQFAPAIGNTSMEMSSSIELANKMLKGGDKAVGEVNVKKAVRSLHQTADGDQRLMSAKSRKTANHIKKKARK